MIAAVMAGLAALIVTLPKTRSRPRVRLAALADQPEPGHGRSQAGLVVAAAAAFVVLLVAAGMWVAVAAAVGVGVLLFRRQRQSDEGEDMSLWCELFAGGLAAGLTISAALRLAMASAGPAVAVASERTLAVLAQSGSMAAAWHDWLADPRLAEVGRAVLRGDESGVPIAPELLRFAERQRVQRHQLVEQRVARAGVWLVMPLGLCFLPAFVLLAVAPVVVGLFQSFR